MLRVFAIHRAHSGQRLKHIDWQHLAMWLILSLLLSMLPARSAAAQAAVTLTATPAFEGNYLPGMWLPITLRIRNDGTDQRASVTVAGEDATFRNVQPLDLPGGAEKEVILYAAMESTTETLAVTVEAAGTVLATATIEVRPRPNERILATVANEALRWTLPRRQDLASDPITAVDVAQADLPERAAGLSSLALVMLYDLPTTTLSEAQREALVHWVHAGGHLVLGASADLTETLAGLPPSLVAASVAGSTELDDAPLAELVGDTGPGPIPGQVLQPVPAAQSFGPRTAPAWVQLPVGLGAVTVLAFDPGGAALTDWPAAPLFWNQLLRSPLRTSTPFGPHHGADLTQENVLAGAISALPAPNVPPADLIFGLLALYAIGVGPGVALVLRRRDRQAWAWLVVPAAALVVGGVAFGLALALRSDQRIFNQLSLIESVTGEQVRVRTLFGGLVPQDQVLVAEGSATMLTRPTRNVSGLYGTIDSLRGDFVQNDPQTALTFEAWNMQGVYAEQYQALPGVQATLLIDAGVPQIRVANTSDLLLRDVVAVYGERIVSLGEIAAGATQTAAWPDMAAAEVPRGGPISYLVLQEQIDAARAPGQAPMRSDVAREALITAALTRGTRQDEGPVVLAWLDTTPLNITLRDPGPAQQATTLLVLRPTVEGSGPLVLPVGWLRPDLFAEGRQPCVSSDGAGIAPNVTPLTIPLRLPAELADLEAEALVLTLDSSEPWPNAGVTTALYDWTQASWIEQDFDGPGDLRVTNPAAYLQGGRLLVRLDGALGPARCIYVSAAVRGTMP